MDKIFTTFNCYQDHLHWCRWRASGDVERVKLTQLHPSVRCLGWMVYDGLIHRPGGGCWRGWEVLSQRASSCSMGLLPRRAASYGSTNSNRARSMGAVQPRKAWAQNGPNVTHAAFYYCSREATQPVYTHWSREMDSTSWTKLWRSHVIREHATRTGGPMASFCNVPHLPDNHVLLFLCKRAL